MFVLIVWAIILRSSTNPKIMLGQRLTNDFSSQVLPDLATKCEENLYKGAEILIGQDDIYYAHCLGW